MNITTEQPVTASSLTVMRLQGNIDASNYESIIAKADALYKTGTRFLLIDLSEVGFMASSGLVALHSAIVLMQGQQAPNPESGWNLYHELDRARESGMQHHVKLLNPQPKVRKSLEITAMTAFFEIYADEQAAIASFAAY